MRLLAAIFRLDRLAHGDIAATALAKNKAAEVDNDNNDLIDQSPLDADEKDFAKQQQKFDLINKLKDILDE